MESQHQFKDVYHICSSRYSTDGIILIPKQTQVGQHDTARQQLEAKLMNETKMHEEVCCFTHHFSPIGSLAASQDLYHLFS